MSRRYYPTARKAPWWMYLDPMRRNPDTCIPNYAWWLLSPALLAVAPIVVPIGLWRRRRERLDLEQAKHVERPLRPMSFTTVVTRDHLNAPHDAIYGPCACGAWHEGHP